jgi:hypothetical protein
MVKQELRIAFAQGELPEPGHAFLLARMLGEQAFGTSADSTAPSVP